MVGPSVSKGNPSLDVVLVTLVVDIFVFQLEGIFVYAK